MIKESYETSSFAMNTKEYGKLHFLGMIFPNTGFRLDTMPRERSKFMVAYKMFLVLGDVTESCKDVKVCSFGDGGESF